MSSVKRCLIKTPENVSLEDITNASIKKAVQISRQFMIMLEDYRYLLSCYQDTCSCHINFDHQIFFRKLENKYNSLSDIAKHNSLLKNALNDDPEDNFENLSNEEVIEPPLQFIKRAKVCPRPRSNEEVVESEDTSDNVVDEITIDAKVGYRCTFGNCDYLTFEQEEIALHLKDHNDGETHVSMKRNNKKKDILYVCEQCGKEFSDKDWLDIHIENSHSSVKMYHCDFPNCNYKTKFRCVADDHRQRHFKRKDFKCTWENCDSEFVTKRDLVAHVNFSHKGIKNYFCSWPGCKASFKDSNRLRHHLFTHTGERPYICDFPDCDASFKQMPHLYKHRKIHSSDRVKIKCDYCERKFSNQEEVRKHHIMFHHFDNESEYTKCSVESCCKYFKTAKDLNEHIEKEHETETVTQLDES